MTAPITPSPSLLAQNSTYYDDVMKKAQTAFDTPSFEGDWRKFSEELSGSGSALKNYILPSQNEIDELLSYLKEHSQEGITYGQLAILIGTGVTLTIKSPVGLGIIVLGVLIYIPSAGFEMFVADQMLTQSSI